GVSHLSSLTCRRQPMSSRFRTLWAAKAAIAALLTAPAAFAERPTIVLMAEDAEPGALARSHQVVKRALTALTDEIGPAGFTVIDERIGAIQFNLPDGTRRKDIELISIARALSRPPVDAV